MQTQLAQRFGADNSIYDVEEKAKLPSSVFDFSRKNNTTIDIGQFMPFDWFRVFPGDKVSVSNRFLLETLPLANPPLTNYRVRVHWFYVKNSSLWKGWQSFISQGRKGSVSVKEIPKITRKDLEGRQLPSSLATALGLPTIEYSDEADFKHYIPNVDTQAEIQKLKTLENRNIPKNGVSILPFLFYQKIWRFDVCPYNLLQDNEIWLPEDLSEEWRLDYQAKNLKGKYFVPQGEVPDITDDNRPKNVPSVDDVAIDLTQLRYACFENDYFTTAKPWLVRGDVQSSVDLEVTGIEELVADFTQVFNSFAAGSANSNRSAVPSVESSAPYSAVLRDFDGFTNDANVAAVRAKFVEIFNKMKISSQGTASARLTANKFRDMIAFSVWQERNALTNGNYNEFVKAHYERNPKAPDYEPFYLGGLSQSINFAQILQTSSSVDDSPLGSQAGLGSSSGQGKVFEFNVNDFGMVMGIMFITPEVYYTQGVGHEWTDLLPEDQFTPEFSQTGFEPILVQEICPTNSDSDAMLFGYQTRNAYLKARNNRSSGLMSLPSSVDKLFGSYVQAREFNSIPKLSVQFVQTSPENIRRDFLAYTNYPAFKLQIASDVKLIRSLPYKSTPNTFGF